MLRCRRRAVVDLIAIAMARGGAFRIARAVGHLFDEPDPEADDHCHRKRARNRAPDPATALAAAHGHDVAVATIIRGLRRRLSPGGQSDPRPDQRWLQALEQTAESPKAQAAVQTLKQVTRPGQPVSGVLLAANAVEDVWEELGR